MLDDIYLWKHIHQNKKTHSKSVPFGYENVKKIKKMKANRGQRLYSGCWT